MGDHHDWEFYVALVDAIENLGWKILFGIWFLGMAYCCKP